MAHHIEGNETVGFRIVDDKIGPLTGRNWDEDATWAAVGGRPARGPGRPPKAVTVSDVAPDPVEKPTKK